MILNGFLTRYTVRKALLLSALLFAILHLNPWQMPAAFVWGIVFGWWLVETRSLWPCLFGHAVANGVPIVLIGVLNLEIRGMTPRPGQPPEFHPLWLDALGVALAAAGLLWLKKAFAEQVPARGATSVLQPPQSNPEDSG
jgi:membrane protease YdiL (CAAX protease family)